MFLDLLGVFAEFETAIRKERQLEGIRKAKERGVYTGKGRPRKVGAEQIRKLATRRVRRQNEPSQSGISQAGPNFSAAPGDSWAAAASRDRAGS
jgi:DNA invertase Pin-like site-specific DNA recombinase